MREGLDGRVVGGGIGGATWAGMLLLQGEGHIDACLLIGGLVVDVHGPS